MGDVLDGVFPIDESDMARGDHYEQTGHFTYSNGICVSCRWTELPAAERQKLIIAGYTRGGFTHLSETEMYELGFGQSG